MGVYGDYIAAARASGNPQEFAQQNVSPAEQSAAIGHAMIGAKPTQKTGSAGYQYNVAPANPDLLGKNFSNNAQVNTESDYYKAGKYFGSKKTYDKEMEAQKERDAKRQADLAKGNETYFLQAALGNRTANFLREQQGYHNDDYAKQAAKQAGIDSQRQNALRKTNETATIQEQLGRDRAAYLNPQTNEFGVPLNQMSKDATAAYEHDTYGQDDASRYATPQAANDYMQLTDSDFYNKYGMNKYRYEELYKDNIDATKALYDRYNQVKTSPNTSAILGQQAGSNMAAYLDNASEQRSRLRTDANGNTYVTATPDTGDNGLGVGTDNLVGQFATVRPQESNPYMERFIADAQGGHSIEEIMQREYTDNRGQITPYYQFLQQILQQQQAQQTSRQELNDAYAQYLDRQAAANSGYWNARQGR